MGRNLKRVPLNFSWPQGETWPGYLNPMSHWASKCPDCDNGMSAEYKALHDRWYGYSDFKPENRGSTPFAPDHPVIQRRAAQNFRESRFVSDSQRQRSLGLEAQRLCNLFNSQWCHHLNADDVAALGDRLHPHFPGRTPSPAEVNEWSISGFGHDSINCWRVIGAECERLGLPKTCATCGGDGEVWICAEAKERAGAWAQMEPPVGEGFQLWQDTSEGSPESPVFSTLRELCVWCAKHATTFGDATATAEQWERMLGAGLVCHREGSAVFI